MSKPLASIDRPLALRLRADLQPATVEMSGRRTWVVKDPLTLEHFQFSAEEYALMEWLREPVSIAQLQRRFAAKFPPQTISPQAIWEFVGRLHEAGLVVGEGSGQGQELLQRMRREQTRRWAMSWTSLLAIRFRGIDPDAFLTAIQPVFRWLVSPAALALALVCTAYALWLAVGHLDEFHQRLPELHALLDVRNLPWLFLSIGVVKVLHELGHALVCKHFGGEVRELGFMLLVFAPCLYCDVSDAWRLPSKWQRIAVSSAGIVVELTLAAVATIAWWYAEPGLVQLVAQNVMIVCTVNTLLLNGNPLLRYDGYYILSDLVETPNLWQRSRDMLRSWASRWFFAGRGAGGDEDSLLPATHRGWLALYGMASKLYLTLLLVTIVWSLVVFLHPYHLQNLAYALGLVVLGSALVSPIRGTMRLIRNPLRRGELRTGRLALAVAVALAAVVGALSLPVNYHVTAPLVLLPTDAQRVHARIEGTLIEVLPAGSDVRRGEVIARLQNRDAEREIARLEGERELRQLRIEHLERLRAVERSANDELPTARAALTDTQRRLEERQRDLQRLALTAPIDGVVIAPPPLPRHPTPGTRHPPLRLATWSGSLLDPANASAFVEPGTLVCLVGDPAQLDAVLLVDDTDVKRLQPGQPVRLRLEQLPGQVVEGEVLEIARHDHRNVQSEASGRADLDSLFKGLVPPGRSGPLYQARVRISGGARSEEPGTGLEHKERSDDDPANSLLAPHYAQLLIGGRGQAKVTAERITVARWLARYFVQTFRLPM